MEWKDGTKWKDAAYCQRPYSMSKDISLVVNVAALAIHVPPSPPLARSDPLITTTTTPPLYPPPHMKWKQDADYKVAVEVHVEHMGLGFGG